MSANGQYPIFTPYYLVPAAMLSLWLMLWGYRAGLADGQIEHFVREALQRSEELIRQEAVQRAIEALADALPVQGRMIGRQAAAIINHALQASTAPGFTAGGL
jgi:hypothetical protein